MVGIYRFEKSLYDLIRGLRNHKGNEKEYIQKTLKECRAEVRTQDMGWSIRLSRDDCNNADVFFFSLRF